MPTRTTASSRTEAVKDSPGPDAVKPTPRERLLQAASELFYAEGVQSVGIDRVIERAGVAKASLYSTFGSKEQLVCAYLNSRHAQTLGRLRAAAGGRARLRGRSRAPGTTPASASVAERSCDGCLPSPHFGRGLMAAAMSAVAAARAGAAMAASRSMLAASPPPS